MSGGATGGMLRHGQWSPFWFLPRIRLKPQEVVIFCT